VTRPNQIEQAMKKTRYFIHSHDEGFSIIDGWTGETVSHHNTWPSATKAAFILEKLSRDQVEAP
jgi:hypothetical protein